jgi:replicative DNA helicase
VRTEAFVPAELEAGVVGALLLDPNRRHDLPVGFGAGHLTGLHRRLFEALERISARGAPLGDDPSTVLSAEARLSDQEHVRLATLTALSAGAALPSYAAQLMERRRREQLRAGAVATLDALQKGEETDAVASGALTRILDLEQGEKREITSLKDASCEFLDAIEAIKAGKAPRIRTGMADVDRLLYVRPKNLVVLAARPGEGKTTFGLQFAANVAKAQRHVLVFSLEMSTLELVAVNLAREAHMDSRRFFDEEAPIDWTKVLHAADAIITGTDGYLHIADQHFRLGEILRIAEKYHRRLGLSLVVVDYLQLVEADVGKGASREQMVSTVSRGLKRLAMQTGVPVLALAQLNREVEKRGAPPKPGRGRRDQGPPPFVPAPPPKLSDLRESGAIEQDANAVCFLHNPFKESPVAEQRTHGPYDLIIAKQRMGPKGVSARLYADFERSAFRPYAESRVPDSHWSGGGER